MQSHYIFSIANSQRITIPTNIIWRVAPSELAADNNGNKKNRGDRERQRGNYNGRNNRKDRKKRNKS